MDRLAVLLIVVAWFHFACSRAASETHAEHRPMTFEHPLQKPQLLVRKFDRKLELYDAGKLVKTYSIALGSQPKGDKEVEGDGKTPEGKFYIFTKNPRSKFHLSLGISYPSTDDADRGLKDRHITPKEHNEIVNAIEARKMPPQKTALGGEIYIHGGGTLTDWTDGCIALADADIEELFNVILVGSEVEILP